MNFNMKKWAFIYYLTFTAILSSCGSGSASQTSMDNNLPSPVASEISGEALVPATTGKDPATPSELNQLPLISVNQRQLADPNVLLRLQGTVTAATGSTIEKILWTQVTGPQVSIPSPTELNNIIVVPDVNIATQLEFRLTAQDSKGRVNSATVSILVKPVPTFVKVIGGVFNETSEKAIFTVHLNAPSSLPVAISYVTQDGSATNQTDYVYTAGEIVLNAGEVTKEISVPLINDTIEENDENFSLQITAIDGEKTYANNGVAIIHNGNEPQLQQTIQFNNQGPVQIEINEQYTNPLLLSNAPGTGDIIYSSSNPSIANINAQGVITGLVPGATEITATKLADNIYLSTSTSFTLQVTFIGSLPSPIIEQSNGYSVLAGEVVTLSGFAIDAEDGHIPTQQQYSSEAPITALQWQSSIDGFLGVGDTITTQSLSLGTHEISLHVMDSDNNISSTSIQLLVGNVAPLAFTDASSWFCNNNDCNLPSTVNDTNINTTVNPLQGWISGILTEPQWVSLSWESAVTINTIDIYTPTDYVVQDYDIEYFDSENGWTILASITGNTEAHRSHTISNTTIHTLRVVVHKGSIDEPNRGRINEIVVFGNIAAANPSPTSSSSVSSSSTSSSTSSASSVSSFSSSSVSSVSSLGSIFSELFF